MSTFVELHLLQNFAPSNLNRDDAGSPKDCYFGGVRRARVSSQCLKRAIRFSPAFGAATQVPIGVRTKRIVDSLADQLQGIDREKAVQVLTALVTSFLSKKMDKNDKMQTAVLLYLSEQERADIVKQVSERWEQLTAPKTSEATIKELAKVLSKQFEERTSAPDIALFGRMLADSPRLNIDAACQVAHAISTHRVSIEMDFFTAVDQLRPDDTVGAGMMGITGFDSACFYRYVRLDWEQLVKNLDGDATLARRTVEGFLRAALEAVPTGKQNSFAAQNPPSFAFAVVRSGGPGWSLANAFEKPVRHVEEGGLVQPSIRELDAYWGRLTRAFGANSVVQSAVLALSDAPIANLHDAQVESLDAWVERTLSALPQGGEA